MNKNLEKEKMIKIKKDDSNNIMNVEDDIAIEHELRLNINDKILRDIICIDTDIEAFIYGHLFTQGYIKTKDDVLNIKLNDEHTEADITIKEDNLDMGKFPKNLDVLTTGYKYVDKNIKNDTPLVVKLDKINDFSLEVPKDYENIMKNSKILLTSNELFNLTGCLHSAGLAFNGEIKYLTVDLGRHNALDKAIGLAMINGDDIKDSVLYTTGRIPTDMINKVIKSGIKTLVTRGAVTYNAIELAKRNNVHLYAFSRGESLNIYS